MSSQFGPNAIGEPYNLVLIRTKPVLKWKVILKIVNYNQNCNIFLCKSLKKVWRKMRSTQFLRTILNLNNEYSSSCISIDLNFLTDFNNWGMCHNNVYLHWNLFAHFVILYFSTKLLPCIFPCFHSFVRWSETVYICDVMCFKMYLLYTTLTRKLKYQLSNVSSENSY